MGRAAAIRTARRRAEPHPGRGHYAHSKDGARSFEPNVLLSDVPIVLDLGHHQSATSLGFVGDYLGLAASDDRAVVAFPDTRYA